MFWDLEGEWLLEPTNHWDKKGGKSGDGFLWQPDIIPEMVSKFPGNRFVRPWYAQRPEHEESQ